MIKLCRNCGKEFEALGRMAYCSFECRLYYVSNIDIFICKIHGKLNKGDVYVYGHLERNFISRSCKLCIKDRDLLYRTKNPEAMARRSAKSYQKNKEKCARRSKQWKIDNKEKVRIGSSKRRKRAQEELRVKYIKKLLTNKSSLGSSDIPAELIELKRQQILLRRKLKEMSNEKS